MTGTLEADLVVFDKLRVNVPDFQVLYGRKGIELTPMEFGLLCHCLGFGNRLISRESIIELLWKGKAAELKHYHLVYVHIKNLRKKLSFYGCPDYFHVVYGKGYRLKIPRNKPSPEVITSLQ